MSPFADAGFALTPAQALRASLRAAGLLTAAPRADDAFTQNGWPSAQALHQGDRLLRTARRLLRAHADAHAEVASLWMADGDGVVAVLSEAQAGSPDTGPEGFAVGSRCSPAEGAIGHMIRACADGAALPKLDVSSQEDRSPRTACQLLAPRWAVVASVLPWPACPLVLATVGVDAAGRRRDAAGGYCSERLRRHHALGQGLAWSLGTAQASPAGDALSARARPTS